MQERSGDCRSAGEDQRGLQELALDDARALQRRGRVDVEHLFEICDIIFRNATSLQSYPSVTLLPNEREEGEKWRQAHLGGQRVQQRSLGAEIARDGEDVVIFRIARAIRIARDHGDPGYGRGGLIAQRFVKVDQDALQASQPGYLSLQLFSKRATHLGELGPRHDRANVRVVAVVIEALCEKLPADRRAERRRPICQ